MRSPQCAVPKEKIRPRLRLRSVTYTVGVWVFFFAADTKNNAISGIFQCLAVLEITSMGRFLGTSSELEAIPFTCPFISKINHRFPRPLQWE